MRIPRFRLLALVGVLAIASAGCIGFEVTKDVEGTSVGPFQVTIECTNDSGTESQTLTFDTFDGNGQQTVVSDYFDLNESSLTNCTIEETVTAGATTVTLACTDVPEGVTCTVEPDGSLTVVGPSIFNIFDVAILVTNTFSDDPVVPPVDEGQAPAAVVATPNTTG